MIPFVFPWRTLRRPMLLTAAVLAATLGIAAVAQTTPPGRAPATHPAPTAADKAAAQEQFKKARELFADKKYKESNDANNEALRRDPTLNDAQLLRTVLQDKLGDAAGPAVTPVAGGTAPGKSGLLSPEQVSLVRLLEMKDDDRTVRGKISPADRKDFWDNVYVKEPNVDTSPEARASFLNPNNFVEVAKRIRQSGNMSYIQKISVINDPEPLVQFRGTVHTAVLQNCATAACHAGPNAGDFHIVNNPTSDPVQSLYTNFYVMSMYNARSGGKVIDRDNPEKSLIIQYALPRTQATYPHPNGLELRNKLSGPNDPRYQQITNWIGGLVLPRPNYGITFPVGGAPATPEKPPATAPGARGR